MPALSMHAKPERQEADLERPPGITSVLLHDSFYVCDGLCSHERLLAGFVVEHRDGHPPRPLPRYAPIIPAQPGTYLS